MFKDLQRREQKKKKKKKRHYEEDDNDEDEDETYHPSCRTVKVTDTEPYYIRAVPATKACIQTKTPLYT